MDLARKRGFEPSYRDERSVPDHEHQNPSRSLRHIDTFFYSGACPLVCNGMSRDKRPDREQVVIGVLTSYEGYPLKHNVFEGNTKDETTVRR
jgi:transposase